MEQIRKFRIIIHSKEFGTCSGLSQILVAKKVVKKLCKKSKKVVIFSLKECKYGMNNKIYGPYQGYMEKLNKPYKLNGKLITYRAICEKVKKMKGGIIIGKGLEGHVLHPNINMQSQGLVSKLFYVKESNESDVEKFTLFEIRLNEIDDEYRYHVPMIIEPRKLTENNSQNKLMNLTDFYRKYYNFMITYEYNGISIKDFIENYETDFRTPITKKFFVNLLLGFVNIFTGLIYFFTNGINHADIYSGNIVFFIEDSEDPINQDNPKKMRMIDFRWKNVITIYNGNKNNKEYKDLQKRLFAKDLFKLFEIINFIVSNRIFNMFKLTNFLDFLGDIKNYELYHKLGKTTPKLTGLLDDEKINDIKEEMLRRIERLKIS